jgi:ABC-type dipeptide/oligopeptide/nickel transport system ATPase component
MGVSFGTPASEFAFRTEKLTFNDGLVLSLEPGTTLIITGPNNSGKSITLREIQQHLQRAGAPNPQLPVYVVTDVAFQCSGTPHQLADWLRLRYPASKQAQGTEFFQTATFQHAGPPSHGTGIGPEQPGFTLTAQSVAGMSHVLMLRLDTQSRLAIASATQSARYATNPATYIHFLQRNEVLAEHLSALVRSAFNRRLIINFGGGQQAWFHVGEEPPRQRDADRVSVQYLEALELQPRLDNEGDGIRSFVGSVLAAEVGIHPVMLIDEPEAFLHPPQARRLGSILAESATTSSRQIILATHSSDIIQGAMDASQNVVVCRMVRDGNKNRVSLLGKSELRDLWAKPLLRSSMAINGIFHAGAVVCEGDSDCRFYEALALRTEKETSRPLDLYFVHGGGKGAIATLAQTYKALDVPTAVIADLDLLRRREEFLKLYGTLRGDPSEIEIPFNRTSSALNDRNPLVLASEFAESARSVLDRIEMAGRVTSGDRKELQELLDSATDWSEVKRYGISKLTGAELTAGKELMMRCRQVGLFVVPVGVLECWWREGPTNKPEWIAKAIPRISESPEVFREASEFLADVFAYLGGRRVSAPAKP